MMNLTPTEMERLWIFTAAEFARRHKACGIRLSHPEAVALIADEMLLAARADQEYATIVNMAGKLLTTDDVLPGVAAMVEMVSVEANFAEGTKMVIVFRPIGPGRQPVEKHDVAGEIISPDEDIEVNAGRRKVEIEVTNMGDRDIQVRSHAHFFETNRALQFDRAAAFGMRLDVPSGQGIRFEPGLRKTVTLAAFGGAALVFGQAGLVNGPTRSEDSRQAGLALARAQNYRGA